MTHPTVQQLWYTPATLAIVIFLVGQACAMEYWPLPYEFEILDSYPVANVGHMSIFSYESGRKDDIYTARVSPEGSPLNPYRSSVYFHSRTGRVVLQKNFQWHAWDIGGRDIDGDSVNEIITTFAGDTLAGVRCYTEISNADTIWEYVILEKDFRWRKRLDKWDAYFELGPVIELDSIGKRGLVLLCNSGFCQMPRGVIMLDASSGQELWRSWFGGSAEQCLQVRTASGIRLLVVATSSSGNGAQYAGASDEKSYLYAVSPESGKEVWRREFSGLFSRVVFASIPSKEGHTHEFVVLCGNSEQSNRPAQLMRVAAESGATTKQTELPHSFFSSEMQLHSDSSGEHWRAFVPSQTHGLLVYNEDLQLVAEKPILVHYLRLVIGKNQVVGKSLHEHTRAK